MLMWPGKSEAEAGCYEAEGPRWPRGLNITDY